MEKIPSLIATVMVVVWTVWLGGPAAMGMGESNARPDLEAIKRLEGEWYSVDASGQPDQKMKTRFSITAAGSAVLERLFPGTDHEMITLYHQDGENLVLTHYCVEGNQPRMRAQHGGTPDKIVFRCDGGSNMQSENDRHMHQGTITFIDEHQIQSEWLQYTDGNHTYTVTFRLKRDRK